jgi:hypothetical protein
VATGVPITTALWPFRSARFRAEPHAGEVWAAALPPARPDRHHLERRVAELAAGDHHGTTPAR